MSPIATNSQLPSPGLKQFRQEGCLSYFFYDPATRELAIIDPQAAFMEDYQIFVAENGLKPVLVIDTRLHWHHLSGSHFLAERYHVPIAMSERTLSARVTRKLVEGEKLAIGALELSVLATPGVSPDAICLTSAGLVFTGDTLLMGCETRVDLPGGDAAALWHSLHERLARLADSTVVFPSYDLEEILFSTIKTEKSRNPDWQPPSGQALVDRKAEERVGRTDSESRRRLEYNANALPLQTQESHFGSSQNGASAVSATARVATISIEKFARKLAEQARGTCFVDVREPDEFRNGHIPGTVNIPPSELASQLAKLSAFRRIYVSCQSGRRSALSAKTLDYLGLPDVVNVSGGFKAWTGAGLPVEKG